MLSKAFLQKLVFYLFRYGINFIDWGNIIAPQYLHFPVAKNGVLAAK
jgi:hypothetical protein